MAVMVRLGFSLVGLEAVAFRVAEPVLGGNVLRISPVLKSEEGYSRCLQSRE
jgi:hypothetical protein